MIFVFGSNLSGIHGAGAALYAKKSKGAVYGIGEGLVGNSYALPTKGHNISFMPLNEVTKHVNTFIKFATDHPELEFQVTCVGCGLAGFRNRHIAPLFSLAPDNCLFDTQWKFILGDSKRYWGTF